MGSKDSTITDWNVGDWAIYRKGKRGAAPGPRARNLVPAKSGENYSYTIDKYWVVDEVLDQNRLILRTRRGKKHEISMDDPSLKKPFFWQRWLLRTRFQAVESDKSVADEQPT